MSSSQAVQASVTEVKRDQEYANFINKNRYFVDGINTYTLVKKYGWKVNDPPRLQNGLVFSQSRSSIVSSCQKSSHNSTLFVNLIHPVASNLVLNAVSSLEHCFCVQCI